MKYIIILIIILIIFILYTHKKNNEKYIDMSDEDTVNKVFNNCGNRSGRVQFDRIKIMGKINNKSLNQFLLDLAYPIGSFYVQFPVKGDNRTSVQFPINRTPAVLFGGDWQEQWEYESVFFRTGGTLANENRVDGFQNYATKRMKGDTSTSQPNKYDIAGGNNGIFDSYHYTHRIGTDSGGGDDTITQTYFDLSGYYNADVSGISHVSDLETRVKNRIIKIWKRVQRDASGNLPPVLEKSYGNVDYDQNFYYGPEQHKYLTTLIPGIPTDANTSNTGFEKAMEFCNKKGEDCTHISYAEGTWRYGKNEKFSSGGMRVKDLIGGTAKPNYKVWEKRFVPNIEILKNND